MVSAAEYYALTESSYLALCPEKSSHMNMGLWPARSIKEAQEALIELFIAFLGEKRLASPVALVDAGSGWGGSRSLYHKAMPEVPYLGINLSTVQVGHARSLNVNVPGTEYVVQNIENLSQLEIRSGATLVSVEAAFHFENKEAILKAAHNKGFSDFAIADLCLERSELLKDYPLLEPALYNAWSTKDYHEAAQRAGFEVPTIRDVSSPVFHGMADYLERLDREHFDGPRRILTQFKKSFRQMADLSKEGALKYVFVYSRRV